MEVKVFIDNYREAFSEKAELPIVFWYSDTPLADTEKINGCFFKGLKTVREGNPISLNAEVIGCGGGKFYTGFTEMPERVPNFVSLKEKYKKTPEMVVEFIEQLGVPLTNRKCLNFNRIDKIDTFDKVEGILFLATPDILSGLTTWAYFDNNSEDAVTSMFGSGCSAVITNAVVENNRGGKRTFLGLFDPSVRPYVEANILSFVIPITRFKEMYYTMRESSLFDTHAWKKVRERINK
ncbi:hypothetical protein D0T51_05615 [Parabacteroides sp. 52]|uniref:DUF169 domain-containing protein n=1 Tax=unclassified Parabacteroides TaxID=2649774 RepID=UPI0013D0B885|nr:MULTISPECIES: DUF169 domain-containing protein [unclassified Parabacteroides]MDH6534558.1 hypothetical protein [Parabacteroides sp. PM5-20]NDV55207.1 hypothetical protein [Parabacteroides sp. 52]